MHTPGSRRSSSGAVREAHAEEKEERKEQPHHLLSCKDQTKSTLGLVRWIH
jgi:hypothetical protein